MAGFLGNYIHYRASNYLNYGVTMSHKKGAVQETDIENIIAEKRAALQLKFQAEVEDKFKDQYQAQLDYLFGNEKDPGRLAQNIAQEKSLEKEFAELVQQKFPGIIVDYATMSAEIPKIPGAKTLHKIDVLARRDKGGKHVKISFDKLQAELDNLKNNFQLNEIKNKYNEEERSKHMKLLKKIDKAMQIFLEEAKVQVGTNPAYTKVQKNKKTQTGLGFNLNHLKIKHKNFFNDLNDLIDLYNVLNKSVVQGILGEMSAAFAGALLLGKSASELKDFITESIKTGDKKSSAGYWQADFSSIFVNLAEIGNSKGWEYVDTENGGMVRAIMPTKDKVDFELTLPEGEKTMSVKNYNLPKHANLTAMKGASFLTLIQNENQNDFINHYFNITANHEEDEPESKKKLREHLDKMHLLIKQIILVNALTGLHISKAAFQGTDKVNMKSAEYFVVNDNSRPGKFKIYSMSELLNINLNIDQEGFTKFAKISGYNDPSWDNTWAKSSAQERITKIILQAHQMKIYAGLSTSVLSAAAAKNKSN